MEKTTKTATARNTQEVAMTDHNDLTDSQASVIKRTAHIVPLEQVLDTNSRGRWQYCSLRDHKGIVITQRYMHADCDALTDRDGNCIMCCAPSPASVRW